jgi:uroporphyrin-3 C-methyltransferase
LIKIQRHDKAIEPLLSAKEQTLARQHIQLLLEQARLAILNVKPMVYKTSLQEAQQWLIRDFDNNDRGVKNAINTLNDLEQINLTVVLPHLDQTLNQLDQLEKKALSDKTQP